METFDEYFKSIFDSLEDKYGPVEPSEPEKPLSELQIGDPVYHDGDSSFCTMSELTVTDIKIKYDPDTGEPYNVIFCGKLMFDGRTGNAINPPLAYYISPK